jgi:hypothetical protein
VSRTWQALLLGGFFLVVSGIYIVTALLFGSEKVIDPAGYTLLIALGLAMGFGMLVILRGARDL